MKSNYDEYMDKECIELCDTLNSLPGLKTFESCCGHLKERYSIFFFCDNIDTLSRLGRSVFPNYSDGKWEIIVDTTDTHPRGVFWLRTHQPFATQEEMNQSLSGLISNIKYWFKDEFDEYFAQPSLPSNLDEAAGIYFDNVYDTIGTPDGWDSETLSDAFKAGAEWMAGQFEKIEGKLVDWYEAYGVDYCSGISTNESFEVPEGFYIRKK